MLLFCRRSLSVCCSSASMCLNINRLLESQLWQLYLLWKDETPAKVLCNLGMESCWIPITYLLSLQHKCALLWRIVYGSLITDSSFRTAFIENLFPPPCLYLVAIIWWRQILTKQHLTFAFMTDYCYDAYQRFSWICSYMVYASTVWK